MKTLLMGCGLKRDKRIVVNEQKDWGELVTLDVDPKTNPDVLHDLNDTRLPFADDSFDEIHAYEVLEHCGQQGDWRFFFRQFEDFWRILKPDGCFCATVPWWQGVWAWGNPGHTRVIQPEALGFLDRAHYRANVYQNHFAGDLALAHCTNSAIKLTFVLRAVKPVRAWADQSQSEAA